MLDRKAHSDRIIELIEPLKGPVRPRGFQGAFPFPYHAGGTSDVMARMVADPLTKELGQQVIVENIGGAGGTIGTLRAAKMAPDGYTIVQTGVGQNAVAHGLDPKLGYDSMKDFIHIAQVHTGPNLLVVHPGQPFKLRIGELKPGHVKKGGNRLFGRSVKEGLHHLPQRRLAGSFP